MVSITAFIIVANVVTIAIGVIIVRTAYRAHRRTGAGTLRWLAAGLGFVTLGALVGLIAVAVPGAGPEHAIAGQSALLAAGIALVARSLDKPSGGQQSRTV